MSSTSTLTEALESLSLHSEKAPGPLPEWPVPPVTTYPLEWADILTVDLSLFDTRKDELVTTVATALQRDGFFYVVGHGIPSETLKRHFDIGQLAFDAVPRIEKEKHRAPIAEKGSFIGYKLQNYWEIKDGVRDRIEHYNFYQNQIDPISRHPRALQPYVEEVKDFLAETRQKVLRRVLSLIDGVLGLEDGYLWGLHENSEGQKGADTFRYMLYDPLTSDEAKKTNNVMLGGHTDFNSISTLISQPVTALQVLMPDNVWRYVKHKENALVINIGDQLSFKSGGILKGTMHRVVRPPPDQVHLRRLGVFHFAQFLEGTRLDLFPSKKVQEEGHVIFNEEIPKGEEWEAARVKSYGVSKFIPGEEYDIEILAGLQVRHYH